jgi:hypothetical protein
MMIPGRQRPYAHACCAEAMNGLRSKGPAQTCETVCYEQFFSSCNATEQYLLDAPSSPLQHGTGILMFDLTDVLVGLGASTTQRRVAAH